MHIVSVIWSAYLSSKPCVPACVKFWDLEFVNLHNMDTGILCLTRCSCHVVTYRSLTCVYLILWQHNIWASAASWRSAWRHCPWSHVCDTFVQLLLLCCGTEYRAWYWPVPGLREAILIEYVNLMGRVLRTIVQVWLWNYTSGGQQLARY